MLDTLKTYLFNNAIAVDQQLNALLGGSPDETLSSRAYRAEKHNRIFGKIFRPLIDTVFFWEKDHCYCAYIAELNRRQLPSNFFIETN